MLKEFSFLPILAQPLRERGVYTPTVAVPVGHDGDVRRSAALCPRLHDHVTLGFLGRIDVWTKGLDLFFACVWLIRERALGFAFCDPRPRLGGA